MFEVLWKAGDKTWMSHSQVIDLNLLAPYLELLGLDEISQLEEGTGNPPHDDPQLFLGYLQLQEQFISEGLDCIVLPSTSCTPSNPIPPSNPTSPSPSSTFPDMPRGGAPRGRGGRNSRGGRNQAGGRSQGNGPSPRHPWVHQDRDTQDVMLEKPGEEPLSFHPLHAEKIYKYHVDARRTNGRSKLPVPGGYHTFSHTFNSIPEGRFKGRMCELNQATGKWTIPTDRLSSKVIRTHFVDEKRYHDLVMC
ncbi:hypothetical protein DXG01_013936 [Tephrocybe rancida]|nr:hypothetical protein DXG01_013936 [Tephrocybe rancida]